ncbi:MAG: Multidrug resistance protein NorM [Candidatus Celerinatantimonas neptuna]|nr:MAG: Multidrug resistance protein NorM [Candidatus Celerinatantimonas neptuna]
MHPLFKQEIIRLIRLAFPVLIAQLIVMGMSVADTLMAGQVSATDLAAVALGGSLIFPVIFFCQGILMAVTPLIASHFGAKRHRHIRQTLMQSLWLALGLSIVAMLISTQLRRVIVLIGHDPELISLANGYIHFLSFGILGACFYQSLRGLNEGVGNTRIIMIIGILGLIANIPMNYVFIHGLLGMPRLGGAGCGLATAIVFTMMAVVMALYIYKGKRYRYLSLLNIRTSPQWDKIYPILRLGFPIAGAIFFEVSLFSVITILMTPFGADTVAAHQIAVNFSGVIFMVPLSIGITLTIRVGHLLGEKKPKNARFVGFLGLTMASLIAFVTASGTVIFRSQIASLYSSDPSVQAIAVHLLLIAAFFQFSDALQVVTAGILRGYQDTRSILWITLISYWPVGLGSGCILGLTNWITPKPLEATGLWLSFVLGLSCAAILLISRFLMLSRNYQRWNPAINSDYQSLNSSGAPM